MEIQVGAGELVDRFVINELKYERFPFPHLAKKEIIFNELQDLKRVFDQINVSETLVKELRDINTKIWDLMLFFHDRDTDFEKKDVSTAMKEYLELKQKRIKIRALIDKEYGLETKEFQNYIK